MHSMQGLLLKQVITHHIGPINLSISKAEVVGVSGNSGAGKSLLLRAIADLDPHQGEISLGGTPQTEIAPHLWRSQVAYIAAESHWWGDHVIDHFEQNSPENREYWLQQAGFGIDSLGWEVHRLSTGERQRLSIVRHLLREPCVLLLDEPTASLDRENIQRVEQMLLHYQQQQQAALLWVSHDQEQLGRVAQRQFRMVDGVLTPLEIAQ